MSFLGEGQAPMVIGLKKRFLFEKMPERRWEGKNNGEVQSGQFGHAPGLPGGDWDLTKRFFTQSKSFSPWPGL